MRRLTEAQSDALLTVMRKAAGKPFDERQALWDIEATLGGLPHWAEASAARTRKQGGKGALSVLAEAAGDVYHAHTGRLPGNSVAAVPKKGMEELQIGGFYPRFIEILAEAASIPCSLSQVVWTCKEAHRALNVRAGNDKKKTKPRKGEARGAGGSRTLEADPAKRKKASGNLLKTHVIIDDDGDEIPEGYELGRDPDAKSADIFAKAVAGLSKKA